MVRTDWEQEFGCLVGMVWACGQGGSNVYGQGDGPARDRSRAAAASSADEL
ncbi:MAG: hypothetical protein ACPIOQ_84810 [Promethearchaeia archaeon]